MAGRREIIREELFGQLYTLRQIEEVFGVKRSTLLERYHHEGRRGLGLIDRCRRGDFPSDEDFIRGCALRGHSQKYARLKLGWSIKQWYSILPLLGPVEWRPTSETIEALQSRARYSEAMRLLRASKIRMHRCRKCNRRHRLDKHIDEFEGTKPTCRSCGGSLRLDKWADDRSWRLATCHCDAYPFPHHKDGGNCYATEREAALAHQIDNAPPHVLDAIF